MEFLKNLCDFWWLAWLLPFLLGWLLGWALMSKWKRRTEELESEVASLRGRIRDLEKDLDACRKGKTELDGEIAILNGRIREKDAEIASLRAAAVKTPTKAASITPIKKAAPKAAAASSIAAGAAGAKDDLKKVEGIGPKIEGLLNADGIMTFAQLRDAEVSRIKGILEAAGPRYKMHNPSTWPDQAGMAAAGRFDDLKKWQDELDGGRR